MRGVILAAGKGRRLESVLPGKPKCLLSFGDKSLIQHQIAALAGAGVREYVIVVGYEQQQIRDHLSGIEGDIQYVENPLYDRTNTLYSLWLTRNSLDQDFVYFNADVLFDYRILSRLIASGPTSNLACVKGACGDEEVKVVVKGDRIVEIGKHIAPAITYGEFIGIGLFRAVDNQAFVTRLNECAADESNWNRFFEYAVDKLSADTVLRAVDISDLPATEIDFPADLERARATVFPRLQALGRQ